VRQGILVNRECYNVRLANLFLRKIERRDAPGLLRLYQNGQVSHFLPNPPQDPEEMESMMEKLMRTWHLYGIGMWAIQTSDSSDMIGRCGFYVHDDSLTDVPALELAYLLDVPSWGRGYATVCASACLSYAFDMKGQAEVYGITKFDHAASRRVMEKVGMREAPMPQFNEIGKAYYVIRREEERMEVAAQFELVGSREIFHGP
jgi:RimJ/RimL family protein N-acetyltransferase